jgi:hypothetical protein
LIAGCGLPSCARAARAGPRTEDTAAPRATIDSHSRRPVVLAMVNGSVAKEDGCDGAVPRIIS